MFAASRLGNCGASNAAPSQRVCALGIVLCPTHVAVFIVPFVTFSPFFTMSTVFLFFTLVLVVFEASTQLARQVQSSFFCCRLHFIRIFSNLGEREEM